MEEQKVKKLLLAEDRIGAAGNPSAPEPAPYRIKSAMVLFALEEALGSFVVPSAPQPDALPQAMRAEIEKRINGAGFVPVSQIVQETYIKEVIDLAVTTSKERSESDSLARLRTLV